MPVYVGGAQIFSNSDIGCISIGPSEKGMEISIDGHSTIVQGVKDVHITGEVHTLKVEDFSEGVKMTLKSCKNIVMRTGRIAVNGDVENVFVGKGDIIACVVGDLTNGSSSPMLKGAFAITCMSDINHLFAVKADIFVQSNVGDISAISANIVCFGKITGETVLKLGAISASSQMCPVITPIYRGVNILLPRGISHIEGSKQVIYA